MEVRSERDPQVLSQPEIMTFLTVFGEIVHLLKASLRTQSESCSRAERVLVENDGVTYGCIPFFSNPRTPMYLRGGGRRAATADLIERSMACCTYSRGRFPRSLYDPQTPSAARFLIPSKAKVASAVRARTRGAFVQRRKPTQSLLNTRSPPHVLPPSRTSAYRSQAEGAL